MLSSCEVVSVFAEATAVKICSSVENSIEKLKQFESYRKQSELGKFSLSVDSSVVQFRDFRRKHDLKPSF